MIWSYPLFKTVTQYTFQSGLDKPPFTFFPKLSLGLSEISKRYGLGLNIPDKGNEGHVILRCSLSLLPLCTGCVREKCDGSLCCDTLINITPPPTPRSLSKSWAMDVICFSFAVRLLQVCFVTHAAVFRAAKVLSVRTRSLWGACGSPPCSGPCELGLFGSISFLSSCFATTGRLIGLCECARESIERQTRAACEL